MVKSKSRTNTLTSTLGFTLLSHPGEMTLESAVDGMLVQILQRLTLPSDSLGRKINRYQLSDLSRNSPRQKSHLFQRHTLFPGQPLLSNWSIIVWGPDFLFQLETILKGYSDFRVSCKAGWSFIMTWYSILCPIVFPYLHQSIDPRALLY